jgi:hypothetical protein
MLSVVEPSGSDNPMGVQYARNAETQLAKSVGYARAAGAPACFTAGGDAGAGRPSGAPLRLAVEDTLDL